MVGKFRYGGVILSDVESIARFSLQHSLGSKIVLDSFASLQKVKVEIRPF